MDTGRQGSSILWKIIIILPVNLAPLYIFQSKYIDSGERKKNFFTERFQDFSISLENHIENFLRKNKYV